jgi:hypothetical protein
MFYAPEGGLVLKKRRAPATVGIRRTGFMECQAGSVRLGACRLEQIHPFGGIGLNPLG